MSDDERLPAVRGWRGDDHRLQVAVAREVGLPEGQAELDSFTEGFRGATRLRDPADGALVVRGRTALDREQLDRSLRAVLGFLSVERGSYRLRVHDGSFELRVDGRVADATTPVVDAGKRALVTWILAGLVGYAVLHFGLLATVGQAVAALVWGAGLLVGSWQLRRGMVSGRAQLGARLALALAMFAREEKLILPPAAGELAEGG